MRFHSLVGQSRHINQVKGRAPPRHRLQCRAPSIRAGPNQKNKVHDYRQQKTLRKIVPIAFETAARDAISFCAITVLKVGGEKKKKKKKNLYSPQSGFAAALFVNAWRLISTTLNQHFAFKPTTLVDKWSGNGRN